MSCFKAYDLRGRVPDQLNPDIAYRLGIAYAEQFGPRRVALGRDVRTSSEPLLHALAHGLVARGVEVLDLGLAGTEESYWAAQQPGVDGAIEVTASHNPIDYNGMKLVRAGAIPVSGDTGLRELEKRVLAMDVTAPAGAPKMTPTDFRAGYVKHLLSYVDIARLAPLKIVVNAGNGGAGLVVDGLAPHLPFEFIRVHHEPDGTFPHGIPNPLLPEMRADTVRAVRDTGADFGVAWDGDFDRCFLFDERGEFIEGYYIVGLLAQALLAKNRGAKVVHDPRLTWNTVEMVEAAGGVPVLSKTGHAFIKERMRAENAVYGGEMSAHHYFRDFAYCDNGNIPWLLVAALVSASGKPLSALVSERMARFPCSGEINRTVRDIPATIAAVEAHYAAQAPAIDRTDGLSADFGVWRFNLRGSNTEPVIRVNVESRGDEKLMQAKTTELLGLLGA
ncbi:phosphomannomutase [Panacagrimonas perspica]|uniref:phosphomannomutase n=1 Tax=Panacagrimonas perspica TaxID=381431 RepID=A0A4V3URM9_9GAMM|nr:phosphomannomutase [Panacagrimonas perspica]TDU28064.1 phosphomannomutase [Panacagrimonas perspica]THD03481.1 phosphomannomutase [Panacagrimonas perspica]